MSVRVCFALLLLVFAVRLSAANYVLVADRWERPQSAAVAEAGGVVSFAHRSTGIGTASSDDPLFAARLEASGAFRVITEDVKVRWRSGVREAELTATPVTPENETFWNMQWAARAIGAPEAWAAGYTGRGVRVALLDGGVHAAHVDLRNNIDRLRSRSFVPGEPYTSDLGTVWHGTLTAGVIAAADNNIGTIGIAPDATLISVKVLHGHDADFGAVIAGILYAADPIAEGGAGADIINISFSAMVDRHGGEGALVSAMARAVNHATSRGVLVICAAGNDGMDLGQPMTDHAEEEISRSTIVVPAESGSGIVVSATGPIGHGFSENVDFRTAARYTNYGEGMIWVAAPGGNDELEELPEGMLFCSKPRFPTGMITVRCAGFDMILTTNRGSGASITNYAFATGTSLAAAHVSGVAALLKQKYPNLPLGALKTLLARSTDDEGRRGVDEFYGHGFINAAKAVQ